MSQETPGNPRKKSRPLIPDKQEEEKDEQKRVIEETEGLGEACPNKRHTFAGPPTEQHGLENKYPTSSTEELAIEQYHDAVKDDAQTDTTSPGKTTTEPHIPNRSNKQKCSHLGRVGDECDD